MPKYPFVYFQPYDNNDDPIDGVFCAVEFDAGYKMTAGMKPDVNHGRMSPASLAQLGPNPSVTGSLLWYFNNNPEDDSDGSGADVTITYVSIVDVQPETIGIIAGQKDAGVQTVEWRVFFADWRDGFVFPRGGRLRLGLMNPTTVSAVSSSGDDSDGSDSDDSDDLYQNSDLIKMCFDAMGITDWATVPDGVDDIAPVTNLQWHGSHAPTELEKLLNAVQATICPHLDGTASVEIYGDGDDPDFSGADLIAELNIPIIDRRGKRVIFSTSPTPMVETKTITGPSDDTWQFVAQNDMDDVWRPLAEVDAFVYFEITPLQALNANFTQLYIDPTSTKAAAAATIKRRLMEQTYRCIRLNPANYDMIKSPILKKRTEADGTVSMPSITAQIAVNDVSGVFYNSQSPIDVPLLSILEGSILHVHDRLVQCNDGSDPTNTGLFMELPNGLITESGADQTPPLAVRLSMEMTDQDTDAQGNTIFKPRYYEIGFSIDASGNLVKMSDDDVQNVLDAPDRDTILQHRPDWTDSVVWQVDGVETDHSAIDEAAKTEAKNLIQNITEPSKQVHIKGFFACDLSGKINEITFNQKECQTIVKVNQYFRPSSGEHLKNLIGSEQ